MTIPADAESSWCRRCAVRTGGVQPRGCGEQFSTGSIGTTDRGPSPRVRGAVEDLSEFGGLVGTIPAGAGSRRLGMVTGTAFGDHPRGCGEQPALVRFLAYPRWTIPAGAGSSRTTAAALRDHRDHPRGCGEQGSSGRVAVVEPGPSPRVRGAAARRPPRSPVCWDHPRGCGEQQGGVLAVLVAVGPSPRVRGADEFANRGVQGFGTIPAGAGSSTRRRPGGSARWDHPRGCGEQVSGLRPIVVCSGPSPRVRGAGLRRAEQQVHDGTIPAGAGSSTAPPCGRWQAWDHPRGCGEQAACVSIARAQWGPSPRVRGAG